MSSHPLLLLLNGNLHTLEESRPRASAVAVDPESGRFVEVGDDMDVHSLARSSTEIVDLQGRTVLPGFIDAHTHLLLLAQRRIEVDLGTARSEEDAADRVRQRASIQPAGTWIMGQGWNRNTWPGQVFPTKASLDSAAPTHPVALWDYAHHALWVNSQALKRADINARRDNPQHGRINRDGAGDPTGVLFEAGATDLIEQVREPLSNEVVMAGLRGVVSELNRLGITGVHNLAAPGKNDRDLHLLQQLRREGEQTLRVLVYAAQESLSDPMFLRLLTGGADSYLQIGGIKIFLDGALSLQTAATLESYKGQPTNFGLLTATQPEVQMAVENAVGATLGVAIHAIGDRAVRTALDAIEASLKSDVMRGQLAQLPAMRFRLEHVQLAAPSDIIRMARLGVIGSIQPFAAVADREIAEMYWGARHRRAYAYQSMIQRGVRLALGSDLPIDPYHPFRIIHAAVTRQNDEQPELAPWVPQQALTTSQAIWAYTRGASHAGGTDHQQGSIARGKFADLIVLGEDPYAVPPAHLVDVPVVATLVGGSLVHGSL
jgi:predicted amidohydrolase YtcJ